MRNLFKKSVALTMAAVMTIGAAGVVSARQADNDNIATGKWKSFSICTREDGGKWEDSLIDLRTDDFPQGQVKGTDYATEGKITQSTSSAFDFNVVNSGWDGQYSVATGELVGDNPWGMTASMTGLALEAGRSYTISFEIMSTLVAGLLTTKHIQFKAHQIGFGDAAFELTNMVNCTADGTVELVSGKGLIPVSATFTVPSDFKGEAGFKFALGALLYTYKNEIAMSGDIYVRNFKITANHQHKVKFVLQGKTVQEVYLNDGEVVAGVPTVSRKNYTFGGWTVNGKTVDATKTAIKADTTITAKWVKTTKPARAKIKKLVSKKSKQITVTLSKTKKAVGYQIQYSTTNKFKKVKTKTTKKTTYTIKKLKSGTKYYVRVKAYKLDSKGNKVLSKKWSKVKSAYAN